MRARVGAVGLLACISVMASQAGASVVAHGGRSSIWHPTAGATFQWQLSGTIDTSIEADVYDIDMFDVPSQVVVDLHALGRKVVCYISAGSYEEWRTDGPDFPDNIIGEPLEGWPGERWLDVRARKALKRIMGKRLDLCREKGFDGVEFDNVDGYSNDSGFRLKRKHQIRYNKMLAALAHKRGLAAGLKNVPELAKKLERHFDFVVNEQCFQYDECAPYKRFIARDKAVFVVEYELEPEEFCDEANAAGFTAMRKNYDLDPWREACWELP